MSTSGLPDAFTYVLQAPAGPHELAPGWQRVRDGHEQPDLLHGCLEGEVWQDLQVQPHGAENCGGESFSHWSESQRLWLCLYGFHKVVLLVKAEVTQSHLKVRLQLSLVGLSLLQVSSPELVHETLLTRQDEFSGRPHFFILSAYVRSQEDMLGANDSPAWRLRKKAVHTSLKM